MRYVATGRYWSSLCARYRTGWLVRGTELDLTEAQAAEFNGDCPGILVPVAIAAPPPPPKVLEVIAEPEPDGPVLRSYEAPPQNRRVGRPPKRRDEE